MADVLWYYARNNEQFGPVSTADLRHLAETGRLTPDDLLWCEGMDAWTSAINLDGLFLDDVAATPAAAPKKPAASTTPAAATAAPSAQRPATAPTANVDRPATSAKTTHDSGTSPLVGVLRTVQMLLWTVCVLVVVAGLVQITRALLKDPNDLYGHSSLASVYGLFVVGAYIVARCGEKLSRILLDHSRR